MNSELYSMIFKRKSFHLFRNVGDDSITQEELREIREAYGTFDALYPEIRTTIRIVPASHVNFKRNAEYVILLYSEKKTNYLMNAGYLGEQLDLYLVSRDIGTLWYGIGKPDVPQYEGLDFVIMIAIHKVTDQSLYRKDMYKAKRKPMGKIWEGKLLRHTDVMRFAPSACNSQPWFVKSWDGVITVYRYRKPGRVGIMPVASVSYFNRIDIGIFLCFLELCMEHEGVTAVRELFADEGGDEEFTKSAEYRVEK